MAKTSAEWIADGEFYRAYLARLVEAGMDRETAAELDEQQKAGTISDAWRARERRRGLWVRTEAAPAFTHAEYMEAARDAQSEELRQTALMRLDDARLAAFENAQKNHEEGN